MNLKKICKFSVKFLMNFFIEIFNENPYSDWLYTFNSLKNEWILSIIKINEGTISIWKILSDLKIRNKKANCSFEQFTSNIHWVIHFIILLNIIFQSPTQFTSLQIPCIWFFWNFFSSMIYLKKIFRQTWKYCIESDMSFVKKLFYSVIYVLWS